MTPSPRSIEAAKAVHVYLVKEGIYLDERQAEQVALAIESVEPTPPTNPWPQCHKCGGRMMHTLTESFCADCGFSSENADVEARQ